mmetsp:Transcript_18975/g.60217  ORF Transcript_18975/g.60217 Transcript_18975/m.60217 type:complete len:367 (-) Transcript_18975:93-1193(-)
MVLLTLWLPTPGAREAGDDATEDPIAAARGDGNPALRPDGDTRSCLPLPRLLQGHCKLSVSRALSRLRRRSGDGEAIARATSKRHEAMLGCIQRPPDPQLQQHSPEPEPPGSQTPQQPTQMGGLLDPRVWEEPPDVAMAEQPHAEAAAAFARAGEQTHEDATSRADSAAVHQPLVALPGARPARSEQPAAPLRWPGVSGAAHTLQPQPSPHAARGAASQAAAEASPPSEAAAMAAPEALALEDCRLAAPPLEVRLSPRSLAMTAPSCSSPRDSEYGCAEWQLGLFHLEDGERGCSNAMAAPEVGTEAWQGVVRRVADLEAQVAFWKRRAAQAQGPAGGAPEAASSAAAGGHEAGDRPPGMVLPQPV